MTNTQNLQEQPKLSSLQIYNNDRKYQMEAYLHALEQIRKYVTCRNPPTKHTFVAFLTVRNYERAYEVLQQLMRNRNAAAFEREVAEVQMRYSEQKFGYFDLEELFNCCSENIYFRSLSADYFNANLKTVFLPKNQSSIISQSRIEPGTMLFIQKAVAFSNETDHNKAILDLMRQFLHFILQGLKFNQQFPSVRPLIPSITNTGKFNIEDIDLLDHLQLKQFMMDQMFQILNFQQLGTKFEYHSHNQIFGYGVFPYLQALGNSCCFNCHISFMGDVMIGTAAKTIYTGETLTANLVPPFCTLQEKYSQEVLRCCFCDCYFCSRITSDHRNVIDKLVFEIMFRLDQLFAILEEELIDGDPEELLKETFDIINQVEEYIYGIFDHKQFKQPLFGVFHRLVMYLMQTQQMVLARTVILQSIEGIGFHYADIVSGNYDKIEFPQNSQNAFVEVEFATKLSKFSSCITSQSMQLQYLFFFLDLLNVMMVIMEHEQDETSKLEYQKEVGEIIGFVTHWSRRLVGWDELGSSRYQE